MATQLTDRTGQRLKFIPYHSAVQLNEVVAAGHYEDAWVEGTIVSGRQGRDTQQYRVYAVKVPGCEINIDVFTGGMYEKYSEFISLSQDDILSEYTID